MRMPDTDHEYIISVVMFEYKLNIYVSVVGLALEPTVLTDVDVIGSHLEELVPLEGDENLLHLLDLVTEVFTQLGEVSDFTLLHLFHLFVGVVGGKPLALLGTGDHRSRLPLVA